MRIPLLLGASVIVASFAFACGTPTRAADPYGAAYPYDPYYDPYWGAPVYGYPCVDCDDAVGGVARGGSSGVGRATGGDPRGDSRGGIGRATGDTLRRLPGGIGGAVGGVREDTIENRSGGVGGATGGIGNAVRGR